MIATSGGLSAAKAYNSMERARQDPAVAKADERLQQARSQLAYCDRIIKAQPVEIFVAEKKLCRAAFDKHKDRMVGAHVPSTCVAVATIGCYVVASQCGLPFEACVGLTAAAFVGSIIGTRQVLKVVMRRIMTDEVRKQFQQKRPGLEHDMQRCQQQFDRTYQATVDRHAKQAIAAPQPQTSGVDVGPETVSIGGLHLPRRQDP